MTSIYALKFEGSYYRGENLHGRPSFKSEIRECKQYEDLREALTAHERNEARGCGGTIVVVPNWAITY